MGMPIFPTESLAGSFPTFPTWEWKWGFNLNGAWIGFTVLMPNIMGIPLWMLQIFVWFLGWGGAVFLYLVQIIVYETDSIGNTVMSFGFKTFNSIIGTSDRIALQTGIFGPLILVLVLGSIAGATIVLALGITNIMEKLA